MVIKQPNCVFPVYAGSRMIHLKGKVTRHENKDECTLRGSGRKDGPSHPARHLPVGDRIPSIRDISRSMKVSISTALEAYRLLEVRGLVEARPQSGYYVSPPRLMPVTEPQLSRVELKPAEASIARLPGSS